MLKAVDQEVVGPRRRESTRKEDAYIGGLKLIRNQDLQQEGKKEGRSCETQEAERGGGVVESGVLPDGRYDPDDRGQHYRKNLGGDYQLQGVAQHSPDVREDRRVPQEGRPKAFSERALHPFPVLHEEWFEKVIALDDRVDRVLADPGNLPNGGQGIAGNGDGPEDQKAGDDEHRYRVQDPAHDEYQHLEAPPVVAARKTLLESEAVRDPLGPAPLA
jgi:hypothetical protein